MISKLKLPRTPVLYTVGLSATFWNTNSSVWAVWEAQGKVDLSFSEQLLRVFFQLFVGIQMCLSNNFEPISKCVFSARHAIKSGRGKKRIEDTAKVIYPRFYKNSNERRV
jgi:hypothetical protein